ncbi:MAG: 30S ribosomal protein S6 [Bacteroidota bacterium]
MRQYEITFVVDPVLSGGEIKSTADNYVSHLKGEGCEIVHIDEMGLRQLAYPIKKRNTGIYFCVEFTAPNGGFISKLELAMRRDERIMRFLTVKLDKYGIKYNEDKRNGIIDPYKKKKEAMQKAKEEQEAKNRKRDDRRRGGGYKGKPKPKPEAEKKETAEKTEDVAVKDAPKAEDAPKAVETPVVEETPKTENAPAEEPTTAEAEKVETDSDNQEKTEE